MNSRKIRLGVVRIQPPLHACGCECCGMKAAYIVDIVNAKQLRLCDVHFSMLRAAVSSYRPEAAQP